MIKAVIFDLDSTLYDYDTLEKEAFARVGDLVRKEIGVTEEQYEEAFGRARKEVKRILGEVAAAHNRMLYCQKTMEFLDIRPLYLTLDMYNMYWNTFMEKMKLYPGARAFLDALHEKGIRVGVCSDMVALVQHEKLVALGLQDDVDCLVTSEEAGVEKPSPEIFALCLKKLRIAPEEACFVGDSYERDIKGAMAAGLHAIWFCPEGAEASRHGETEKGYDIVSDYNTLQELFFSEIMTED